MKFHTEQFCSSIKVKGNVNFYIQPLNEELKTDGLVRNISKNAGS